MDDETAELILALQLQDLEDVKLKGKGKGREDSDQSDADLAIQLQKEECQQASTHIADRRMARSIHRAVQDDGATVVVLASEENRAAADRDMACRLGGQTAQTTFRFPDPVPDDDTLSRFSTFNIEDDSDGDTTTSVGFSEIDEPEGSAWAASRSTKRPYAEQRECVSCQDFKEVVAVPCQHLYCHVDVVTNCATSVVCNGRTVLVLNSTKTVYSTGRNRLQTDHNHERIQLQVSYLGQKEFAKLPEISGRGTTVLTGGGGGK